MSKPTLLPANRTPLEADLEQSMARLEDVPIPLRTIWSSTDCPTALLPWLAWTVSVDEWDPTWPEATKREVIAGSFAVHQKKGTAGALRRAIEALALPLVVREWFQYGGAPYMFRLDIVLEEFGLSQAEQETILRVVEKTKNLRSHLEALYLHVEAGGNMHTSAASDCGDIVTVDAEVDLTKVMNLQVTSAGVVTFDAVAGASSYEMFILLTSSPGTVSILNFDFSLPITSGTDLGPTGNDVNCIVVALFGAAYGTPSDIVLFEAP